MSELVTPVRKLQKKGLGRGLGSLLGGGDEGSQAAPIAESNSVPVAGSVQRSVQPQPAAPVQATAPIQKPVAEVDNGSRVWKMPIEKLSPSKEQPRKTFEPEKLAELAASIKEKGVLIPILARKKVDGTFEIIAGERRWRASQAAGLKEVPVLIKESENKEALEIALIENIQRHDLNPMEEAEAYHYLANKYVMTQQQIAEKVGKERATVANLMRLCTLTPDVREMVKKNELQLGQAKVLVSIDNPDTQKDLAKKAVRLKLSVRALERLVAKVNSGEEDDLKVESVDEDYNREMGRLAQEIQSLLGTKVNIQQMGRGGKITVQFYSTEELNQIMDKIRKIRR